MKIYEKIISLEERILLVKEREVFLSILKDIKEVLQNDSVSRPQYASLIERLINRIHPSLIGLLTKHEFEDNFATVFEQIYARETLVLLINALSTVSKSDDYKFKTLIGLIHQIAISELKRILCAPDLLDENERLSRIQFTASINSFSDRVYNYFGNDPTKKNSTSTAVAAEIVARFQQILVDAIQFTFETAMSQPVDLDMCALILARLFVNNPRITRQMISYMVTKQSPEITKIFERLLLSAAVEPKRQEQMFIFMVESLPTSEDLFLVFGDSIKRHSLLRRVLVNRVLLERIQVSLEESHSISKKIVGYLALVETNLLKQTFVDLLRIWSDQAKLVHMANFQQQLKLSIALIEISRAMSKNDKESLADEIHMLLLGAVPEYLKIADTSRRQMGMILAETLINWFRCSNKTLNFEYNQEDDLLKQLIGIIDGTSVTACFESEIARKDSTKNTSETKNASKIRSTILDSDDEEETENADKSFRESIQVYMEDPRNRINYLRDCLEHLNEKEDYKKFAVALNELPRLISDRAIGFDELALQLMEKLIYLENRFNLPGFYDHRLESMELCFALRPELVSYSVRILFSQSCAMAERFFILEAIECAAMRLTKSNEEVGSSQKIVDSDKMIELGKVTRRAPKANLAVYSRNPFHDIAPQFVYPLLNIKELGPHLKVENYDQTLVAKILITISKLLICARGSPSISRIASALSPILYAIRQSQDPILVHACLCCYAAIIDSIASSALMESFETEMADWIEWISGRIDSKQVEAWPVLRNSIDLTLNKLIAVVNKDNT